MTRTSGFKALLCIGAIAAATTAQAQTAPVTQPARTPASTLFIGPCLWADVPKAEKIQGENQAAIEALVGALAGSAVDQLLDGVGSALTDAAAARTFSSTASLNIHGDTRTGAQCLQLWSGTVETQQPANWSSPGTEVDERTGTNRSLLQAAHIFPTNPPRLMMELWVRPSADGAYVSLTPTLLIRNASLENNGRPTPDRPITINAAFADARAETTTSVEIPARVYAEDQTLLDLKDLRRGSCGIQTPSEGYGQRTEGNNNTSEHPDPNGAGGSATAPRADWGCLLTRGVESGWFANPFLTDGPMTVTVTVSETRPRNPVLGFVSRLFTDSRDELDTVARQQLLPQERLEAQRVAVEANVQARQRARESFSAAETARTAYCSAIGDNPRRLASSEFAAKQALANIHARQAGEPAPYSIPAQVGADTPLLSLCPENQPRESDQTGG